MRPDDINGYWLMLAIAMIIAVALGVWLSGYGNCCDFSVPVKQH